MGKCIYYFAIALGLILLTEFVIVPFNAGVPRDVVLMRFFAKPGTVIDNQVINSMGFSGDEIGNRKPEDSVRILILGGSTMFNRHLGERLKEKLQSNSKQPIEVLNASIRSHTSRSDLLKFQLLKQYEFDYLIYYNGLNDLWANHTPDEFYSDYYAHLGPRYTEGPLLKRSALLRQLHILAWPLIQKIDATFDIGLYSHTPALFPKKENQNLANFRSVNNYKHNVGAIIDLARASGTTVLLGSFAYSIPDNYTRRAFLDHQLGYVNPDNYDRRDIFNWGTPEYVREGLNRNNQVLKALAPETNTGLIDIDKLMSGRMEWFGDPAHFNDAGTDAFTNILLAHFKQQGWLGPVTSRQ